MLAKLLRSEATSSLADQAVVSGGNFLTTLVLARILAPSDYGTFSLLFLSLFAINTCHSSLVVYPLTLRGATASKQELGKLAGSALVHTLLLSMPLALLLGVAAFAVHRIDLWPWIAAAMVGWQVQETARRALLSALRFRAAILPDFFCYVGQGLILLLLHPSRLEVIFALVAATSLVAAVWQFFLVRISGLRTVSKEHGIYAWKMGRFILAGNSLNMLTLQIPSWALALTASSLAVAGYQSILNLVGVANPIIFSVSSLLIPAIARDAPKGYKFARQTAVRYGLRYALLLIVPFAALFIAPHAVMSLAYGSASPYLPLAPLLRWFVVAFAIQYAATVVGAYEGGMSRPKTYMWVQITGTGVLLTLGIALIHRYSVAGAVLGMLIASMVRLITFLFFANAADRPTAISTHLSLEMHP